MITFPLSRDSNFRYKEIILKPHFIDKKQNWLSECIRLAEHPLTCGFTVRCKLMQPPHIAR